MLQQIHLFRIREFRVLTRFEALRGSPDPPLALHVSSRLAAVFGRFSTIDPAIHFLVVRIEGGVPKHETCVTPWPLQAPTHGRGLPSSPGKGNQSMKSQSVNPTASPVSHHFSRIAV